MSLYSLAKGFGPIFEGVWAGFRERGGSIFSNHQHFAVSTGICGVACPLPASRVDTVDFQDLAQSGLSIARMRAKLATYDPTEDVTLTVWQRCRG